MVAPMSTDGTVRPDRVRVPIYNRAPKVIDSPYEQERKRLERLKDDESLPKPPDEVMGLRSTRALEDWADLMLCQDSDQWGSIDLSVAAQLVCVQELCRDMQFQVQTIGDLTEMDRWGNNHPSVSFRLWQTSIQLMQKLRGSLGIHGSAVADPSQRSANRKAKNVLKGVARAVAGTPAPPKEPDDGKAKPGTDISA